MKVSYVGLEFVYDEWVDVPAPELPALIESEFGLRATGNLMQWLVERAREGSVRVLPPNDPSFHPRSATEDGRPLRNYFLRVAELIHQRDRWAAERVNSVPGRGIVVYGRSHIVSGNLPVLVSGLMSVITADPKLAGMPVGAAAERAPAGGRWAAPAEPHYRPARMRSICPRSSAREAATTARALSIAGTSPGSNRLTACTRRPSGLGIVPTITTWSACFGF
jgi:hypothetical protein